MTVRTKGNAKWLFKEDVKDKFLRRIPNGGAFGNRDIVVNGQRLKGFHIGTDYGANIGEKLIAYDDYEVKRVGGHSDYGKQVFLYFPKINKTGHYAHMNRVSVKVGDKGKAGDVIGESGNTGKSQGAHLHFSFGNGIITDTSKSNAWEDFEKYVYKTASDLSFTKEDGNIIITYPSGSNIRKEPSASSKRVGGLKKGEKINYTGYTDNEGYRWVKTSKGWVANRALGENVEHFAKAEFNKPSSKPKPKPQPKPSKIGKYANFGGNVRLFQKAVGDECYHSSKNGQKNVYTNVRNTSAKVLDEKNGRVLVSVPRFNPNRVWIANAESTISNSAKYKL